MVDRGASPQGLLWDSIAHVGERAALHNSQGSGFKEEMVSIQCYPRSFFELGDDEDGLTTRPPQRSGGTAAPSLTVVPKIIADMLMTAHWRQWQQQMVFHRCRDGLECDEEKAEIVVGSDGLLSAAVHGSSDCFHVRLHGMKGPLRYFVSFDTHLDGEISNPDRDIATYAAPQPNHLDGFGWAAYPLTLDLTVLLVEKIRNTTVPLYNDRSCGDIRYQVTARILQISDDGWPTTAKPIFITLKEGFLKEILSASHQRMNRQVRPPFKTKDVSPSSDSHIVPRKSYGHCSFSPVSESSEDWPWLDEFGAQVTRDPGLFHRILDEPVSPFCFQEASQSPPFQNFFGNGFSSPAAFSNGHITGEIGHTHFFRDLESEANLRLLHLDQRRLPSATVLSESCCQQCCEGPCDKTHHAAPFRVCVSAENLLDGRYAYPSPDAKFFYQNFR
ncbi:hypothetical protein HPB50_007652 [Hyalomma asiaticum]|uniref:Uncharacterized protein n=1 Tax=Hyalomma asiaticum TaxID=266040 RepID=A0ACB7TGH9_HYAAI|nr:hypothetical protein HPB50_007652 [Hyalomma asiaticum]